MARYNNSMVAHVWAQGQHEGGRSHNGNFYFEGRILYSYGRHFVVGVRLNNLVVFNECKYSISTSRMQSEARYAAYHLPSVAVSQLNESVAVAMARLQDTGQSKAVRARYENILLEWAEDAAEYHDLDTVIQVFSGVGMRWAVKGATAAHKRGLVKVERAKRATAAKVRREQKALAIAMADTDMFAFQQGDSPDLTYRFIPLTGSRAHDQYVVDSWTRLSKSLYRLVQVAMAEGLSARRVARLKALRRYVRDAIQSSDADAEAAHRAFIAKSLADWGPRWTAATTDEERRQIGLPRGVQEHMLEEGSPEAVLLAEAQREHNRTVQEFNARQREEAHRLQAERIVAWRRGEGPAGTNVFPLITAVRRSADGERLETSRGAEVPWDHAVRAFRFIRMCVERGEGWRRNGRSIRVGHFSIDEIKPNGDMKAGCHNFVWQEMKMLAEAEGVFELEPSDEAVESRAE